MNPLGRREPTDWEHVEKHPYSAIAPCTVATVNKTLRLPWWHWKHDQGAEGACVGHGSSMMMSLLNNSERYDPFWLWNESKEIDEWPDTNPGDDNGTSVRASCDVLRKQGHTLWKKNKPLIAAGIQSNRWATSVDEMRTALSQGIPCSIGVNWYELFDEPVKKPNGEWWIDPSASSLGKVRGGHCVCIYGASDRRKAFRMKNSWGKSYPLVWVPYEYMDTLLDEYGECTLITDRK